MAAFKALADISFKSRPARRFYTRPAGALSQISLLTFAASYLHVSCVSSPAKDVMQRSETTACPLGGKLPEWSKRKPPKLVFMSLDGLNQDFLSEYVPMLESPHPFGLKRILSNQNSNRALVVQEPTITSSSHTSTITCSKPERHGIFANTQWNGLKTVSGFAQPTGTETFASSLASAGYKVVTAGYPTLDNTETGRKVSEGFAYGNNAGKAAIYDLSKNSEVVHEWKNKNNETIAKIKLNADASGGLSVSCPESACSALPRRTGNSFDLRIETKNGASAGYVIPVGAKGTEFYVSSLGSNNAFPAATEKILDACGIVFSPGKDTGLEKYGAQPVIAGLEHRLDFFNAAWTKYLPDTEADILFLYLEDIDSLRHQFSGDETAKLSMLRHIEKVDGILGRFIQSLPAETHVVIMGDHGMSTVKYEINIRKVIPAWILENRQIFTSGGSLFIYDNKTASAALQKNTPRSDWMSELEKILAGFRIGNTSKPVFEKIYSESNGELRKAGLMHPEGPKFAAFANEDFALQDSLGGELLLADTTSPGGKLPRPRGQHGHNNLNGKMRTVVSFWGPQFQSLRASDIKSNTDVVPAIARALNLPVPVQCRDRTHR